MTVTQPAPEAARSAAPRAPRVWPLLAAGAASAVGFALFFALPYLVSDLGRIPLHELAGGASDPSDFWPAETWMEVIWGWGALLTLALGPSTAAVVAFLSSVMLLARRRADWPGRVALGLSLLLAVAALAWAISPTGSALVAWFLD